MARKREDTPHPYDKRARARRIAKLVRESPLKFDEGKQLLVEFYVDARIEVDVIREKRAAGTAMADEVRSFAGLMQSAYRLADRLGLSADKKGLNLDEPDEDEGDEDEQDE